MNLGCDSAGPGVGRWQGSTAGERSAPRFPQWETQPWGLAGTAEEQELAQYVRNPVHVPAAKANAKQDDDENRDAAVFTHAFLYFFTLY